MRIVICWFRQDLRLSDHHALQAARDVARHGERGDDALLGTASSPEDPVRVLPLYILEDSNGGSESHLENSDTKEDASGESFLFLDSQRVSTSPKTLDADQDPFTPITSFDSLGTSLGAASRWWLHYSLCALDASFEGKGMLAVYRGAAQDIFTRLAEKTNLLGVYWHKCYEPHLREQEEQVQAILTERGIVAKSFEGTRLWEGESTTKIDGTPYKVFTPFYKNGCLANAQPPAKPLPRPEDISFVTERWLTTSDGEKHRADKNPDDKDRADKDRADKSSGNNREDKHREHLGLSFGQAGIEKLNLLRKARWESKLRTFWEADLVLPKDSFESNSESHSEGNSAGNFESNSEGHSEGNSAGHSAGNFLQGSLPAFAGETAARKRLNQFLQTGLKNYQVGRDIPGENAVSRLSVHLHWGEISPREVWAAVCDLASISGSRNDNINGSDNGNSSGSGHDSISGSGNGSINGSGNGSINGDSTGVVSASSSLSNNLGGSVDAFTGRSDEAINSLASSGKASVELASLSDKEALVSPSLSENCAAYCRELGWREFAISLLTHFPQMPTKNIRKEFDAFPWAVNDNWLEAWKRGLTGYPIVDAGMRELYMTGYMHNRVRMIVASFLVKNLRINWREGARWFWECLVDADLANNSTGWQWVAGSGADAAPYFRVFNPILQGKKFDKTGVYTKKYVPELKLLPDKFLFEPWNAPEEILQAAGVTLGETYPTPIVNQLDSSRAAVAAFKRIKKRL